MGRNIFKTLSNSYGKAFSKNVSYFAVNYFIKNCHHQRIIIYLITGSSRQLLLQSFPSQMFAGALDHAPVTVL